MRTTEKYLEELATLPKHLYTESKSHITVRKKALIRFINDIRKDTIQDIAMVLGEGTEDERGRRVLKHKTMWAAQEAIKKLKLEVK